MTMKLEEIQKKIKELAKDITNYVSDSYIELDQQEKEVLSKKLHNRLVKDFSSLLDEYKASIEEEMMEKIKGIVQLFIDDTKDKPVVIEAGMVGLIDGDSLLGALSSLVSSERKA
jgi:hypothetical protein